MTFNSTPQIWLALVITVFLMISHYLASYIPKIKHVNEKMFVSFGGGMAASYVFLFMIPELVEGNRAVGALLEEGNYLTNYADLLIFMIAYLGFLTYYGIERLSRRASNKASGARIISFRIHMAAYMLYNGLITYLMPVRVEEGLLYSIIFSIAISLHFIISDRGLKRHFLDQYNSKSRLWLVASLFIGWLIATITIPINILYASLLIAFSGGSILFNVFKEEIPDNAQSSYKWFFIGTFIMTLLLIFVTSLEK